MALIFGGAIILFTYIPGISAKDVGLRCQKTRLEQFIQQLHLKDKKTGKFITDFDTQRIASDSLLSSQYVEADDVARYVRDAMGKTNFEEKYGKWELDSYRIRYIYSDLGGKRDQLERSIPVELGDYTTLLNNDRYRVVNNDTAVILYDKKLEKTVLQEKMKKEAKKDSPLSFAYDNDSLLVVFSSIWADSTKQVCGVSDFDFQVFGKK